ncbi:hypothetical protein MVEN_01842800 [Mycena venus]|uniref:Uncharacterized protein n=1 Tax=Mycena venus TaxID=2733690 RepID=A0A8H6XL77_9AGAR|nr:hypothetical protein MVEN_01842800 [Mycena venus]
MFFPRSAPPRRRRSPSHKIYCRPLRQMLQRGRRFDYGSMRVLSEPIPKLSGPDAHCEGTATHAGRDVESVAGGGDAHCFMFLQRVTSVTAGRKDEAAVASAGVGVEHDDDKGRALRDSKATTRLTTVGGDDEGGQRGRAAVSGSEPLTVVLALSESSCGARDERKVIPLFSFSPTHTHNRPDTASLTPSAPRVVPRAYTHMAHSPSVVDPALVPLYSSFPDGQGSEVRGRGSERKKPRTPRAQTYPSRLPLVPPSSHPSAPRFAAHTHIRDSSPARSLRPQTRWANSVNAPLSVLALVMVPPLSEQADDEESCSTFDIKDTCLRGAIPASDEWGTADRRSGRAVEVEMKFGRTCSLSMPRLLVSCDTTP